MEMKNNLQKRIQQTKIHKIQSFKIYHKIIRKNKLKKKILSIEINNPLLIQMLINPK